MTDEVIDETIKIIAEKIEADPATIKADSLISEIDVSSLDLADIIFELEDRFDIEIDLNTNDAWDHFKTVADIAAEVSRLVKSSS